VASANFQPVIADEFELLLPDRDIHDVTLWLLHSCRIAIFEVTQNSGALMELERIRDYGIFKSLLLYYHKDGLDWRNCANAWNASQMVQSLAQELGPRCVVRPYAHPEVDIESQVTRFLHVIMRSAYGEIHGL
jgi:hypothetical protein